MPISDWDDAYANAAIFRGPRHSCAIGPNAASACARTIPQSG